MTRHRFNATGTASAACLVFPAIGMLAMLIACLVVTGCSTAAEREPRQGPWSAEPVDIDDPRFGVFVRGRIDAVLGERLVIPIELAGRYDPTEIGRVVLDDGRKLDTRIVWIGAADAPGPSASWLTPSGIWSVTPAPGLESDTAAIPAGPGTWALVIDPPVDAVGQGVWIAGRRSAVNWLPDPFEVARRVPGEAWASPVSANIRSTRSVQSWIEPERRSPVRRWRARLFSSGLSVPRERRLVGADGTIRRGPDLDAANASLDSFGDPTLEAVARLTESRWLIGLARLYEADSEVNLAVRRRLTTHVDFGEGTIVPVWPVDREGIDRLLSDLLDQRLSPRERARRASQWLEQQPQGVSWIVSDAGLKTPSGGPMTSVGLANLRWASSISSLESFAGGEASLLDPLPPLTARLATVASRPQGATRSAVVATIAEQEQAMPASAADFAASPPGLRIESFLPDWSLPAFLIGSPSTGASVGAAGTGVLVYRDHRGRWVVYAECRSGGFPMPGGATEPSLDGESLRLSFGPVGSSIDLVVTIAPTGEQRLERPVGLAPLDRLDLPALEIETGRFPGGWFARVIVPPLVIEDGRTLRLGIDRTDGSGIRTAWPRAMLPWQVGAARGAIDLTLWDE